MKRRYVLIAISSLLLTSLMLPLFRPAASTEETVVQKTVIEDGDTALSYRCSITDGYDTSVFAIITSDPDLQSDFDSVYLIGGIFLAACCIFFERKRRASRKKIADLIEEEKKKAE